MRYEICDGDTTTASGRVIATSQNDTLRGRAMAYEGDPVWCPECQTTGWIACVGKRPPSRGPRGREQALSGDWCMCKCDPPPHLISFQQASFAI